MSIKNIITSSVFSRTVAAIVGGYLLANLITILLSYLLPGSQADAVITGMLVSFLIYAGVIIWVFAAKTTRQVWSGLLVTGLSCFVLILFLAPEGLL